MMVRETISKSEWKPTRIEQLASNSKNALAMGPFGSRITKDNFVDSGVPVIRGTNLTNGRFDHKDLVFITEKKADELAASNAFANDLIFTHRGTLGQVGIIPQGYYPRYVVSQSQMKLSCDQTKVLPMFLYYYFRSEIGQHELLSHTGGSGVPAISSPLTTLRNIIVHLPSLPVQQKIAAILSAYDDLIENNTRRIAILEEMAQSLYREWFVHFRFPGHEKKCMVESALGMIPEGWEVVKLGDALTLQRGFDLPVGERCQGNVPVYAATGLNGTHNTAKVKGPGVLTGRSGSLGTVTYIHEDFWPLNTTLWIKDYRLVSPAYAYYLLSSIDLKTFNSGAAVPTLNRNDLHLATIVIPYRELIDEFDSYVIPLFKASRKLRQKNDTLRQTRDLLLPRLIAGEVDVEELEVAGVGDR